jgi:outer membrane receptor protein involved in Fe transport
MSIATGKVISRGVRAAVRSLLCAGAASISAGVFAAQPAQGTGQQAPAEEAELEAVVVTGSRIAVSGFTTPTPVTVLGAEAIEDLNITNIGVGANQLPAFRATTTPATNGWGSFNVGAQSVNLRGLGTGRNLVLVNGRRLAPVSAGLGAAADLNMIPSALVQRMDVVTGGASAAYGADALAGATNIILNTNLTGLRATLDYGTTDQGDGDSYHVALAGGMAFAGGRGHFVVGGEWDKSDGVGNCLERKQSYCQNRETMTYTNSGYASNNGLPNYVVVRGTSGFIGNYNGVIVNIPGSASANPNLAIRNMFGTGGITFNDAGQPIPYTLGQYTSLGYYGTGNQTTSGLGFAELQVPVERYATFGHAYFDFTDSVRGWTEVAVNHVKGDTLQAVFYGAARPIYADNVFIPQAVRTAAGLGPLTPSTGAPAGPALFNLLFLGPRRGESSSDVNSWMAATGLDLQINDKWKAVTSYQYSHTHRLQVVDNAMVTGNPNAGANPAIAYSYLPWALDAVMGPNGTPVCRASISTNAALRAAAADCKPYNPFGRNVSQESLDYVYSTLFEDQVMSQHALSAGVTGSVFDLPAGPLAIAAGLEFRRDKADVTHDDLANLYAYFQNYGTDYSGKLNAAEGYLEAEIPLISGMKGVDALSVNAAGRRTRYKISGEGVAGPSGNTYWANTWKVGMAYQPVEWTRFRATVSRDIRAPIYYELFATSSSSFGSVLNRWDGNNPENPSVFGGGNPQLRPEKGLTKTFGVVVQPPFIDGLSASLDYYAIKITGNIGSAGAAQTIIDNCYQGITQYCDLLSFSNDARSDITQVRTGNVNLQWTKNQGIDTEIAYRLPLSKFSELPGRLDFRLLGNHLLKAQTLNNTTLTDSTDAYGSSWTVSLITGYTADRWQVNLTTRYVGGGKVNVLYFDPSDSGYQGTTQLNSVNTNHIGSATYFNLNGSISFDADRKVEAFWQINNLLDRLPPVIPTSPVGVQSSPSSATYYDTIGRSYKVGVRLKL